MSVKTEFSIKDLENLTGIKAHTIRIWEKRYHLLEPKRTKTNIRHYDMVNMTKLLNITFLYNEGYKISKIAQLKSAEITQIIGESNEEQVQHHALHHFKQAMFDFDQALFDKTYYALTRKASFESIFFDIFIALLNDIGLLWQTGTIDPVHERFISELIKQKIIENILKAQNSIDKNKKPKFALFLPHNEIHEIGLLFANYTLLNQGHQTLYLGANIPLDNLEHLTKHYDEMIFFSYFTVKPDEQSVAEYVKTFQAQVKSEGQYKLWLMGSKIQGIKPGSLGPITRLIHNLEDLTRHLQTFSL